MAAPPFLPGCLPRKRMLVIGEKGDEVRETASDDAFELYLLGEGACIGGTRAGARGARSWAEHPNLCAHAANPKAAEREEKRGRPRKDDAGLHVSRESEGEEGRDGKGKDGRTVQAERIGRVLRELYAANLHLDTIRHVIWRVLGPDLPNSPLADRRWGAREGKNDMIPCPRVRRRGMTDIISTASRAGTSASWVSSSPRSWRRMRGSRPWRPWCKMEVLDP